VGNWLWCQRGGGNVRSYAAGCYFDVVRVADPPASLIVILKADITENCDNNIAESDLDSERD
jgi:hypothetical protein